MTDRKPIICGYIRVSTDKQDPSIESQRQRIVEYVANGQECGDMPEDAELLWLVDRAETGSVTLFSRPQGCRIIERLEKGDHLIFWKLDRVFRSMIDLCSSVEIFNEIGILPHCVHQQIDTVSPSGQLFLQLLTAVAEFERKLIGERTKEGMRHRRQMGRVVNDSICFGWNVENKKLYACKVDRKLADIIEVLIRNYCSLRQIHYYLEKDGWRRPATGKPYSYSTISEANWYRERNYPSPARMYQLRKDGEKPHNTWREFLILNPKPTPPMPEGHEKITGTTYWRTGFSLGGNRKKPRRPIPTTREESEEMIEKLLIKG